MTDVLDSLEQLEIAAASLDGEQRIVQCNALFASALGRHQSFLRTVNLLDALGAAASDTVEARNTKTYRVANGGVTAWYRLDLKPDAGLALLTDVSTERRALETLREFYAMRDKLLHDGKIGTWRYDPDAEIYYFSTELTLGYDGAGAPVPVAVLQQIQHPEDLDTDTGIRERITREGGSAEAEMRYREADGSWTHLHVHYRAGSRTASGRYQMFGISQNITPVAQARDRANEASRRLGFALHAAQAGVFEFDYANRRLWLSPELKDLIGREAADSMTSVPMNLFVPEEREAVRDFLADVRNGLRAGTMDARIVQPGTRRWVRIYYSVTHKNADGTPLHGVGLLLDIDERKRQEIALAEAQRAAEFANRTKTEFLANMSHELRTPLNAILGFSEVLADQIFGPLKAKYVDYARDIHRSGHHLLELVNDVLDLSKLEAGKLELRESEIEIAALAGECLALVRGRANSGHVALETDIPSALPLLCADERTVRQLLLNFLSNAVKFTPEGGTIVVSARLGSDGGLWLAVADSGIGMNAAEIEIALAPFGQVDSKLARNQEGTGLGLPICRSLIELHGGEMSLTSEPGKGTTLAAHFPPARTVKRAMEAVA